MLTAEQLTHKVAEMRKMLIMVNKTPDRSMDFSHYIRRELPAVLDELERLCAFAPYIDHRTASPSCPAWDNPNSRCTCGLSDLLPFKE